MFCEKFNRLSGSEKKFENRLRFDEIIVTRGWRIFLGHSVVCITTLKQLATMRGRQEATNTFTTALEIQLAH